MRWQRTTAAARSTCWPERLRTNGPSVRSRGNQPTHLLHTLARLQLARELRAQGQLAEARQAYADFNDGLRHGDPRHPLLKAATREAAAIQAARPSDRP